MFLELMENQSSSQIEDCTSNALKREKHIVQIFLKNRKWFGGEKDKVK